MKKSIIIFITLIITMVSCQKEAELPTPSDAKVGNYQEAIYGYKYAFNDNAMVKSLSATGYWKVTPIFDTIADNLIGFDSVWVSSKSALKIDSIH